MSAALSIWLKDFVPYTPGVVRKVVTRELIMAAREFYRQSGAWTAAFENLFFSGSDYGYVVTPPADAEVLRVCAVESNLRGLQMVAERPMGERQTGTPTSWYSTGPDSFDVWPTPDQYDDQVIARAILIPTEAATTLPDMARVQHYDGIFNGTLGRLFSHPGKPYSSPQLAEYHLRRFRNAIGEAAAVSKGGGQNWRFPSFGK